MNDAIFCYFRGWVRNVEDVTMMREVFFVDYGNTGVYAPEDLGSVRSGCWDLMPQAYPFKILGTSLKLKSK